MMVDFDSRTKSATAPRVLFQTRITFPNFSDTQYAVSGRWPFFDQLLSPERLLTAYVGHRLDGAIEKPREMTHTY
jgi:hypothetical protein